MDFLRFGPRTNWVASRENLVVWIPKKEVEEETIYDIVADAFEFNLPDLFRDDDDKPDFTELINRLRNWPAAQIFPPECSDEAVAILWIQLLDSEFVLEKLNGTRLAIIDGQDYYQHLVAQAEINSRGIAIFPRAPHDISSLVKLEISK